MINLTGKNATHFVHLMVNHDGSLEGPMGGPFSHKSPTTLQLHQASLVIVGDRETGELSVWKNRWPEGPQSGAVLRRDIKVLVDLHVTRARKR